MSIGSGKSSSNQGSQQTSDAYGYDTSFSNAFNQGQSASQSFNESLSNAMGENFSQQESQSGSFVDQSQQPYLEQLYANASKAAQGYNALDQSANYGTMIENLKGLSDPTATVNAQLEGLRSGLNTQFAQGLNEVGANATSAGAFGGARHGLTEAALGGEIAKAYTQGYGDIMANANSQATGANQVLGTALGQQQASDLTTQFGGLQALQGLLGGPTVLNQSSATGSGYGYDQSASAAQGGSASSSYNLGQTISGSLAERIAQSQATSWGSSNEAEMKMGFK